MWQFVMFTQVAVRAGQNKIVWPIGAASTEWNAMVDMIALAYITLAIPASTLLHFINLANVGSRECAYSPSLARFAPSACRAAYFDIFGALGIFGILFLSIVRMVIQKPAHRCPPNLGALFPPSTVTRSFFVLVSVVIVASSLAIVFEIFSSPLFIFFSMFYWIFPVFSSIVLSLPLLIFGVLSFPFAILRIGTAFASASQRITTRFIEIFGSWWEQRAIGMEALIAAGALFEKGEGDRLDFSHRSVPSVSQPPAVPTARGFSITQIIPQNGAIYQ